MSGRDSTILKRRSVKMNFTREDAKRLINDLPKVYKEMSEQ